MEQYDFSGYATRNDLKCSDGRTIRKDAFKDNDGSIVPLVWQHLHNEPSNILGHSVLENRDDGVYAYCKFNDTPSGKTAKELVSHGDITRLSIYANQLKQKGGDVLHGMIREVSLVLAGANPGAYIDYLSFEHGDGDDSDDLEAVIGTGETIFLAHAADEEKEAKKEDLDESKNDEIKEEVKMADNKKEKTVKQIYDEMTDEQKDVVHFLVGMAVEQANENGNDEDTEDQEGKDVKHNLFDNPGGMNNTNYLSHDDMKEIFSNAKRIGSLRDAVNEFTEGGTLMHAIDTTGMDVSDGNQTYFVNDPSFLYPNAKPLNNAPEWIQRDMGWVQKVIGATKHTPFSRIKSIFANITADEARAKGYLKGNMKTNEVFTLLKRETDPQTVYKKQQIDRDDAQDIVDFDVVAWLRAEMRNMLDEELARAMLIGDGRDPSSNDKISELHIRPILSDAPLFTIKAGVVKDENLAKNFVKAAIRARKDYKGTGNPTLFTTETMLTEMLLIEDEMGRFVYDNVNSLATRMRVKEIVTVPVMENLTNADGEEVYGIIVNMADYTVGADKGGAVNMFDDFDIDYNQQKYLIETRISGALTKPFSAIVLSENP